MWTPKFCAEARREISKLDGSLKKQVVSGIAKVAQNPLPAPQGYGKPLGNKCNTNLTRFFKIKYRGIGIRVVYTLAIDERIMNIIVVSLRDDEYCYQIAQKRFEKYGENIFLNIFD